jgi:YbbR domain-containing protein
VAMPNMTGPLRALQGGGAGRPPKVRLSFVGRIARALERDMGLRLISVMLAIGLWIFVNAGQRGALETFQVPVIYHDLPLGFVLTSPHPDFVRIQVSGPRTLLSIIDPTHLRLRLDLTGVGVGQASFKIGADSFPVPRHTEVTSVLPSQIVLDIDRYVTREVPIHLALSGLPGAGYKIASSEVAPATIVIRGPSRQVARVDQVDTEPLSIASITSDFSREVDLMAPASAVRLTSDQVTAKVALSQIIAHQEFHDVPINVRDTDLRFRIDPRHVNLELSGPLLTLEKINLKGAVYIEAAGLDPGSSYSVPLQIDLPDGVALVRQTPEKVRLKMFHDKQVRTN